MLFLFSAYLVLTDEKMSMMEENVSEKLIKFQIQKDFFAHDLLTSIFVCAASSYRHDTLLRPFPPFYLNSEKDFDSLRTDLGKLVKIEDFMLRGHSDGRVVELLNWLYSKKKFSLKTCDSRMFSEIKEKTGDNCNVAAPTHIFEVIHCPLAEDNFMKRKGSKTIIYAYHGSRLENFYSILNNGLCNNLNKNSLFGKGTYFSSELSVSLDYSPYSHGWSGSALGQKLSCIAVCELIEDEDVKCKVKSGGKHRRRIEGSLGGDIPEKYYVVTNDDLVRVKYLLVYASKDQHSKKKSLWFMKYKFIITLTFYFLMLIFIGLYNSGFLRSPKRFYS